MIVDDVDKQIESDIKYREEVKKEILRLKKERNAVILAHNYQRDEIQEIADIRGDSLALARAATKVDEEVIVFCGVLFMAESAYILNPKKTVLLPVKNAGCPLADMATVEKVREYKKKYPGAAVVCYVNSSAEVKAESDVACTSSNAVNVVRNIKEKRVIFLPDRNLARYVASKVPEKEVVPWDGFCITHVRVKEEEVVKVKSKYPNAEVIAHPECEPEVLKHADCIASTGGMFEYVRSSGKKEFIICTENGMLYGLREQNPDKKFYLPSEHFICANMKMTTLGRLLHSLKNMVYKVKVEENVRIKAEKALERMLEIL